MLKKKILPALLLIVFFSCKGTKNTPQPAPVAKPVVKEQKNPMGTLSATTVASVDEPIQPDAENKLAATDDTTMRFIASFYSIGEGTEVTLKEKLKSFAVEYGKRVHQKINYNETFWGREGETDYCFPLKELTAQQQTDFINGAKEVLNTAKHVYFFENRACRKGR